MKKTVLYIGNFSFPLGNAAGKRVYGNGKVLKELGYEVIFIGMDVEFDKFKSLNETKEEYDGFTYYNFPYPKKNIDWINYKKTFDNLVKLLLAENLLEKLGLVIYYGSPSLSIFISKLIRFCRKQNIKVISDCVDWLITKTNNPIFNMVKWADNTYQKAYLNRKADGIIAISSYLSNYYNKHECKTVIIPPLSPFDYSYSENNLKVKNDSKIVITYAGLPFRKGQLVTDLSSLKDRIDKTIRLLAHAKRNGCQFIFNIYGFSKEEYLNVLPNQKEYIDQLNENLIFHGRKPNNEVVENIIKSDFTILIRDINRTTTAGFPTKVSESISCGTPVIANKTSDLEDYIEEGKSGFFLNNEENSNIGKINDILNKEITELKEMKKYCQENNPFHYKNYKIQIEEFLDEL